jgi:hypothetical protein
MTHSELMTGALYSLNRHRGKGQQKVTVEHPIGGISQCCDALAADSWHLLRAAFGRLFFWASTCVRGTFETC